jgi:hypothetical protein
MTLPSRIPEGRTRRPESVGLEPGRALAEARHRRRVDVVRRRQEMGERELALAGRMQHGDLDRPERAHRPIRVPGDANGLFDCRVEKLHVADHEPLAVVVGAFDRSQAVRLGQGHRQRLLAQHRQSAPQGRLRHVGVGPRGQDEQPVELDRIEHRRDVAVSVLCRYVVSVAQGLREALREVADRSDLERLAKAREQRQVHGLRHRSETRDRDAEGTMRRPGGGRRGHEAGV